MPQAFPAIRYNGVLLTGPSADGSADQVLKTNGSGTLSFTDAGGTAALPFMYLRGLDCSNAADADHDITVAVGECRDKADSADIVLSSAITKQIDASWAAGTNAGGMFTGSVAVSTTYHFFLIKKDSDGSIDAGWDTSSTAANIPAGYTAYRRIASFKTDGSANLRQFFQCGHYFEYGNPIQDWFVTNPGTTASNRTLSVPSGLRLLAVVQHMLGESSTNACYGSLFNPDSTDTAPSSSMFDLYASTSASVANRYGENMTLVHTNTSGQVRTRYSYSSTTTNTWGHTRGYFDDRSA